MQSIGLSVEEIAIVYLALPLTTFLAPPVSGTYNLTKWVYYHWCNYFGNKNVFQN